MGLSEPEQQKNLHGLDLDMCTYTSAVQLCLQDALPTTGEEVVSKAVACLGIPFIKLDCLVWCQNFIQVKIW